MPVLGEENVVSSGRLKAVQDKEPIDIGVSMGGEAAYLLIQG
ncbi:MAG: hypothetical protein ACUVTR_00215 [Dehalococcoidia bacterium]